MLEILGAFLQSLKCMWAVAADWNMDSVALASLEWVQTFRGSILTPGMATCGVRTYDYFVTHGLLTHFFDSCVCLSEAPIGPHKPSLLTWKGLGHNGLVPQIRAPKSLPFGPLIGPQ